MATFRIHEDQENRVPELRQKQVDSVVPIHQKRAVLGVIDNKRERQIKAKQPLGPSNAKTADVNAYNKQNSRKLPPPVVPVAQFEAFKVYEDTKENEIEKILKERQRKNKHKDPASLIYKGTEEDRFVTKKQLREIQNKTKQEAEAKQQHKLQNLKATQEKWSAAYTVESKSCVAQLEDDNIVPDSPIIENDENLVTNSPMSIEKAALSANIIDENKVAKSKCNKDLFFEMSEYRSDIYIYLREHETRNRPKPSYMKKQPDITYSMRTILVDWLVEVSEEYKLQTETLYLAINYIDRFLSYMSVVRAKLQLVGTAAMFIAAKYEEIYPPEITEFVYITDDTYNKKQVLRMEHLILKVLAFDLSVPTPLTFIRAICISNEITEKVMYLAMYLSELSMLEADPYLESLPSLIAAAAVALARFVVGEEPWSVELRNATGYELQDLKKTIEFLHDLFRKAPAMAQQAIQEKYKKGKHLHVAKLALENNLVSVTNEQFKSDNSISDVEITTN